VNITLSAETELIDRTREYARNNGTTLNRLIRRFMTDIAGTTLSEDAANEFAELARRKPGRSPKGYRFDRSEAHRRE
jgi:hypothetical protein